MNLLCPSCQNPLSVPEQYAGQLMKCPLCNNNFTVPALPAATGEAPLTFAPPEPEVHEFTPIDLEGHTPPAESTPLLTPTEGDHGLYGMTPPEPTPQARRSAPRAVTDAAPPPPSSAPAITTKPASPSPRPTPAGYAHTMALTLNPHVLPWIAPAGLFLVFVLSFFPWVGHFYGSYSVMTQNAWQAAFGGYTLDEVYDNKTHWDKDTKSEDKPGAGVVMIFFLFLGLFPAVLVGVGAVLLPRLQAQFKMPPGVAVMMPWRWLIVMAFTLVPLLFLFLQVVTPFSIESRDRANVARDFEQERKGANAIDTKWIDINEQKKITEAGLRRTSYMRLSFLLLVISAAGAALTHWVEHRGASRPLPRIEILW
jgi:hypothetical protein